MQKHFNLSNENQNDKLKSKGLSNKYLNALGTLGDVVLSKPIKPMHVIFKGKSALVQNIYIVYKTLQKLLTPVLFLKIVYLAQLK